uniref:Uncharacterized protein n=1 Tax=Ananas comosus var. bracteatus TaxID=296719 RepID=A0A6V7NH57_ANACO|nr:unnamed protein product [Ananas comosus var. bracteatus]
MHTPDRQIPRRRPVIERRTDLEAAPGPRALPLIGSMHHVARAHRGPAHWALRELARVHGPLMLLRMGHVRLAVASSPETAEAILRTQDLNFAFRPQLLVGQIVGYGCSDMVFSPYGLYYKQLRRICLTELLGPKRVRAFASIRKDEVAKLIEDISAAAAAGPKGSVVNLTRRLTTMTNAMISRAAFGGQNAQHHRFLEVAQSAVEAAAGFSVADAFPSLRFLDVLSGLRPRLQKVRRELDEVFDEIIEQHQQKKKNTADESEEEDLIDLLLRLKDNGDLEVPLSIDNIKAVILDLFLAGTDTSSALLQCIMSELIRNPKVMAKAQTEVREALKGDDGIVIEEAQVNELHYLKLVVKETLRLHPPVPLLLPRVCQSTCHVAGYEIPAGARIVVNAWAIARDPEHWSEPERFVPERFAAPALRITRGPASSTCRSALAADVPRDGVRAGQRERGPRGAAPPIRLARARRDDARGAQHGGGPRHHRGTEGRPRLGGHPRRSTMTLIFSLLEE